MDDRRLRKLAEDIEAQIQAGRPGRHDARAMTIGRYAVSGRWLIPIPLEYLPGVRKASAQERDAEQLLSRELLELHGYRFDGGKLTGPSSAPGGTPGDEPAQHDQGEGASAGAGQSGSGGGTISPGEARLVIGQIQDIEDWRMEMRRFDIWTQAQERRSLFFGRYLVAEALSRPSSRAWVQNRVAEDGDATEIELWSDKELLADYSSAELGEGGGHS